ncbi:MAG: TIGR03619 family F420-dependent LLM class oxidoreductase [Rudaea sp.]
MHFGIDIVNFGDYANPGTMAQVARTAEESGWEGLFIWDHLAFVWGMSTGDPWVLLTAAAGVTDKIKLGPAVTPLPRRRPHVLAGTLATLDQYTGGRMVLGVGLGGVTEEFTAFGESADARVRAARLDESLEVLKGLWSGKPFSFQGEHLSVDNVTLSPVPVQRPRIPIWVGGNSGPARRRAARWDGWFPDSVDEHRITKTPQALAADVNQMKTLRGSLDHFDIIFMGYSEPVERAKAKEYAGAGATWWLECLHGLRGSFDQMIARVRAGPPS